MAIRSTLEQPLYLVYTPSKGTISRGVRQLPTVIDLFCGAGGLSYGFELAGFSVGAAVDTDPVAGATYRLQNPNVPFFTEDVRGLKAKRLLEAAGGHVDLVIGGPSCQGFSTHGKRDPDDPRNYLFKEFVRLVRELRPSWVVMENVKGLLTYDRGRYRAEIHNSFKRAGYRIESRVLRAVDFGVPQLRERMFFIATNTSLPITFPAPSHCPPELAAILKQPAYMTVRDAIGDLPLIGDEGEADNYGTSLQNAFQQYARHQAPAQLTLHRARRVSDLAMSIIRRIPQGSGIRAIPPQDLPERFRRMRTISTGELRKDCTTLYYRLRWSKPSYTITCYFTNVSSGPFVHPSQNRALTPREAARLQTFPDRYQFVDKQVQRQIGNAVPPLLARAVAAEIAQKFGHLAPNRLDKVKTLSPVAT
jgi:DNA (cytosine-5)-methyltransferase 1